MGLFTSKVHKNTLPYFEEKKCGFILLMTSVGVAWKIDSFNINLLPKIVKKKEHDSKLYCQVRGKLENIFGILRPSHYLTSMYLIIIKTKWHEIFCAKQAPNPES